MATWRACIPADFRHVSTIFVPCETVREQITRRIPHAAVVTMGCALPPAEVIPDARRRFLAEELGVEEGAPLVLLADQFRAEETTVALRLIEAASTLAAHIPDVQVMIAGEGDRLGELEARAAEVNERHCRRVVLLPGHRDDVDALLALATVAVGSGRFAREAIGAGVATVAAGAAGMLGVYTDETASVANFTCGGRHGRLEPVTGKALASEIIGLFSYAEYREQFAAGGQMKALAEAERGVYAARVTSYYRGAAPRGHRTRTPQRIAILLPDDPREMLFTLPAISGLRARFPQAQTCIITHAVHRRFFEQNALADTVLTAPVAPREWPGFARQLQQVHADLFLAFRGDFPAALMAGLSFAPHRFGFAEGGGNLLFSDHLRAQQPPSPARALLLTYALGVSTGGPLPAPTLPPDTREMVDISLLAAGVEYTDAVILLCPEADERHAWPEACWIELAQRLVAACSARIVVLGGAPPHLAGGRGNGGAHAGQPGAGHSARPRGSWSSPPTPRRCISPTCSVRRRSGCTARPRPSNAVWAARRAGRSVIANTPATPAPPPAPSATACMR